VVTGEADLRAHVSAVPMLAPVRLAAVGAQVIVLDAAHRRLATWDSTVRWLSPPVSRAPHHLSARSPVIGTLDAHDARLTIVARDGGLRGRIALGRLPTVLASCPFADGGWLVLTTDVAHALTRVESDGRVSWQRTLPWPDVARRPAALRQGVLHPWRGSCIVALAFGPGWAVVSPDGELPTVMPLRDPLSMRRAPTAPLLADATTHGDTLELLVAGTSPEAFRLLDRYHLVTGAYLGTVRLPGPVRSVTAVPDGWAAIAPTPTGPHLVRLTLRSWSVGNHHGTR
jgi:hypothetical protein